MEEFTYKLKYLKYKAKLLEITNFEQIGGKSKSSAKRTEGSRYSCNPKEQFDEMCKEDPNGKYKNKTSCTNDCEIKYINRNLIEANLKYETFKFNKFIEHLMANRLQVYLKGGTVIGLYILKMIWDKAGPEKFSNYWDEFVQLDLIRDWDFVAYTKTIDTDDKFRAEYDAIALLYSLVPRAKTFILYQAKRPIKLDDQALFEISVMKDEVFSNLELPLTTMKMRINRRNLLHIFMFAKSFYSYKVSKTPIDIGVIKHMVKSMEFFIYPHREGLFSIKELTPGALNPEMVEFVKTYAKNDRNLTQFLITQIQEPHRIFYRLMEKNIPKTNKIKKFLIGNEITKTQPTWLFNSDSIIKIMGDFIKKLGQQIAKVYKHEYSANNTDRNEAVNKTWDYIRGINLSRIRIEYDNIKDAGHELVKLLLGPLVQEFGQTNIENLDSKLNCSNKLIDVLKFLDKSKFFA